MAEIIRACEPDFSLSPCADEPDSCTRTPHCGVRKMWSSLDSLIWQQLDVLSLADVVNGTSAQRAIVGSSATARDADLVGIS
jgi:DNA-binding IscR family transcriptional regulator